MLPRRLEYAVTTPDGDALELFRRGDEWTISINRFELMSSRAHGSEAALARLAIDAAPRRTGSRWLVGGLGMGYTLRASLDALDAAPENDGIVVVAEVFEAVVRWNRGVLGHLANHPLRDSRVRVEQTDIGHLLDPSRRRFDVILLDIDNGPEALSLRSNRSLYEAEGLVRWRRQLCPGGVLAVWSESDAPWFKSRLQRAGFRVDSRRARAGRSGRGARHTIFVAVNA